MVKFIGEPISADVAESSDVLSTVHEFFRFRPVEEQDVCSLIHGIKIWLDCVAPLSTLSLHILSMIVFLWKCLETSSIATFSKDN